MSVALIRVTTRLRLVDLFFRLHQVAASADPVQKHDLGDRITQNAKYGANEDDLEIEDRLDRSRPLQKTWVTHSLPMCPGGTRKGGDFGLGLAPWRPMAWQGAQFILTISPPRTARPCAFWFAARRCPVHMMRTKIIDAPRTASSRVRPP
jgi:hypothetical protein